MLEIKSKIKTNINDDFSGKFVYISKIYTLFDGDYYELEQEEQFDLKVDINEWKYILNNSRYYSSSSAFESILDLGKTLVSTLDIRNIDDINRITLSDKITVCELLVKEWIELNAYPYSLFNKDDFIFAFIKHCVILYIIYDIHKWLIKIENNFEVIITAPNNSVELNKLNKLLNFIQLNDFIINTNLRSYIMNLPEDYNLLEDHKAINSYEKKIEANYSNRETYIKNYCNVIRRNILGYITSIIQDNSANFFISKQLPFHEANNNQYRIIDTATSIIGIAYNQLLLYLTSSSIGYKRVICANPNCNNEFIKTNRQEYCSNKECKAYRNRLKSYTCYHKQKNN